MLVSTVYTAKWTPCNEILHFNRELDKQVLINVFHKACDIKKNIRKMRYQKNAFEYNCFD